MNMHLRQSPRYRLDPNDRVMVHGLAYQPIATNEIGHVVRRLDPPQLAETFEHAVFERKLARGQITIDPGYFAPVTAAKRLLGRDDALSELTDKAAGRLLWRETWAEVFLDCERRGIVKKTDQSIKAARGQMTGEVVERLVGASATGLRRHTEAPLPVKTPPSARTIRKWVRAFNQGGLAELRDARAWSGNRTAYFSADETALLARCAGGYASANRPTKTTVHEDVVKAFKDANLEREADGLVLLRTPSRNATNAAIASLDPFMVDIAREGLESALKKHTPVGQGLVVERPLQRVEMDEWKVDLITLMAELGIEEKLTPSLRKEIEKGRWWLTVALDCATRAILAMRLSRKVSAASAISALEMITLDKGGWADAVGALSPWIMHGRPDAIVTDGGPSFQAMLFRIAATDLGSRVERPIAGKPWLRPYIERVFSTITTQLLSRLSGRTFGSIQERGEHPSERHAVLTPDDLAFALVRWVVDIYHNNRRPELGGATPLEAWRKLEAQWGTTPPPDLRRRRLVFGTKLERVATNSGVVVLGVRYHSEALHRWAIRSQNRHVEIRWLPADLGAVIAKVGHERIEVPAVHDVFKGMTAAEWHKAATDLRARMAASREATAEIVGEAISAIRRVNDAAVKRADLTIEDWSAERVEQIENEAFVGFQVSDPVQDEEDDASDGTPAGLLTHVIQPAVTEPARSSDTQFDQDGQDWPFEN